MLNEIYMHQQNIVFLIMFATERQRGRAYHVVHQRGRSLVRGKRMKKRHTYMGVEKEKKRRRFLVVGGFQFGRKNLVERRGP